MDAMVMAGGFGRRLDMGEKGLVHALGKPLLEYVLTALMGAKHIDRIFVATSENTPETYRWVQDNYSANLSNGSVIPLKTPGSGFVADLAYASRKAGINAPFFIIMSDLVLITPQLIDMVIGIYDQCDTSALSTYVPLEVCASVGIRPDTVFHKDAKIIVPVGVNILDGKFMDREQSDFNFISQHPEFAININTVNDLKICEQMLTKRLVDEPLE
ncbi:MAG: NTP transferase domain-containing protein [Methanosarcinales archaeon]|nr:NTP transferase domain-containing protein [Methanosarcinales archaeon]